MSSAIKRRVLRTAFCVRGVSLLLIYHPSLPPGNKRVVWYLRSMLALTFATKSPLPQPWLQGSSFLSPPPPPLNKPFSWLQPRSALHTEWAVLSQCFSPDPWELWKTVKKAFCLRTRESERESRREASRHWLLNVSSLHELSRQRVLLAAPARCCQHLRISSLILHRVSLLSRSLPACSIIFNSSVQMSRGSWLSRLRAVFLKNSLPSFRHTWSTAKLVTLQRL